MRAAVRLLFLSLSAAVFASLAVVLAMMLFAPETFAQTTPVDYDSDDDNLIEIGNLERLNAVRWDLDGNGASTNAGYALAFHDAAAGMGCPGGCRGYELAADLDFDDPTSYASGEVKDSWTSGDGWLRIGSEGSNFAVVFDGGGHTIRNLFINRVDNDVAGLFGFVGSGGAIAGWGWWTRT